MVQISPDARQSVLVDVLVLANRSHEIDGINDYTERLLSGLRDRGDCRARLANPRLDRTTALIDMLGRDEDRLVAVVLQYNPFSFARWGFAPWLPLKLWRLKRQTGVKLVLMVHEMYVPLSGWRSTLMGMWQRVQFLALRALADLLLTSITAWATHLSAAWPRRPIYHLPVGSNLPDMRSERSAQRQAMELSDETLVLASFGTSHPGRLTEHLAAAADAIAEIVPNVMLLNLGADAPPVPVRSSIRVISPGRLEQEEVARHLAAADIYLAPFVDGISTRRTTLMAALQHGLPVVATDGYSTDLVLRSAIVLSPTEDRGAFAQAARRLATDEEERRALAIRSRCLYESDFDWPVITGRLLEALSETRSAA